MSPTLREEILALGVKGHDMAGAWMIEVEGEERTRELLQKALAGGANVDALTPKRETLEAIFVRKAL